MPQAESPISALEGTIAPSKAQPIQAGDLMQWFAYDSMGRFAFGCEFNNLEQKAFNTATAQQRQALKLLGPFNLAPWLIYIALTLFSGVWRVKDWYGMIAACDKAMRANLSTSKPEKGDDIPMVAEKCMDSTSNNVASWLVHEYETGLNEGNKLGKWNLLSGNGVALMIGAR